MTPERWQRVQQLFHDALEHCPDERAAFVLAASGDDPGLQLAVERMLAADAAASDLFDEMPGALRPAPDAEPGGPQGVRIGVYDIVRTLGSGGMGTVYLAERKDVGKQVAVKVVRGGLGAAEYRQRLLVERRVLARLEHPHITRLLDAGITPDGLPYFVMELVHGEPIDHYADARQLTVTARLDLFAQVASAVHYAHQNLIVHSDLKPSNVLVDASGTAKLLDFGIAKLLTESGEDNNRITASGLRPMTPQYAAPEQLRGDAVTTATDVYALGMLLYELLTGRRPYRPRMGSPVAWAREVVESEAIRPSSRVNESDDFDAEGTPDIGRDRLSASRGTTVRALGRMLRGDLDTIVLKALEKDPARRYASVQQLLDDVGRYRQGRPIAAKPATWGYRGAKFVKRHPFSLGAAAAAVALLVGLGISVGFERAAQQRARTEAERAREATAFVSELFGRGNPRYSMGRFADTSGLLAWGERRAEALAGQPAIQAQVLSGIAETYTSLGIRAHAQPLFERVLTILRRLHPGDDADVATALFWLGLMHVDAAEFDQAERVMNESLAMRRRLLAANDPLVAEGIGVIALPLLDGGHAEAAERKFREALQIAPDGFTSSRHRLPNLHIALAAALLAEGRGREAETEAREGLRATHARLGDEHVWFTAGQIQLARAFQQQGRLVEAESLFREAVAKSARAYGPDHPRLTVFLTFYASLLRERGDAANAEAVARRAFEIQQRVLPAEHYLTLKTRVVLGRILIERGRPAEAEPILREGVTGAERRLKPDNPDLAQARVTLGTCLVAMGRKGEGEPLLASALGANDASTREAREGLERLRRSH